MTMFKLIPDWKRVLLIGYSTWAMVLAIAMMIGPQLLWHFFEVALNPNFLGWSVVVILALGNLGRILVQSPEGRWRRRAIVIGLVALFAFMAGKAHAMAEVNEGLTPHVESPSRAAVDDEQAFRDLAVEFIGGWEGKRNTAYLDVIGVPTICYGHTRTVSAADVANGRFMTDAQCDALLLSEILEYREEYHKFLEPQVFESLLPYQRDVAFTSLTINIGWGAVGRSTAIRRLNSGDIPGACEALTWFNKAGGVEWPGLRNRRNAEYPLCMVGVEA